MQTSVRSLCQALEGDGSLESAFHIIDSHFNPHAGTRAQIANEIFKQLSSEYQLVKRPHRESDMRIKNKLSGYVPQPSLRHKQRFVVETQQGNEIEGKKDATLAIRPTSPVTVSQQAPMKPDARFSTSHEMRRFSKLTRGGHLVSSGAILDLNSDSYSTVYDTEPTRNWLPHPIHRKRAQTPLESSLPMPISDEKKSFVRPLSGFSEYVHASRIHVK